MLCSIIKQQPATSNVLFLYRRIAFGAFIKIFTILAINKFEIMTHFAAGDDCPVYTQTLFIIFLKLLSKIVRAQLDRKSSDMTLFV